MTTTTTSTTAAPLSPVQLLDRPLTSYYLIVGATALLTVLGLVMVLSASSVMAFADSGSSFSVVGRQALWVLLGLPLLALAARLPVRAYRLLAYPALIGAVGLLVLVLVPGIGVNVNGNQNWIDLGGPLRLQPSEAAKLALVLWGADLLARKQRSIRRWRHLLVPLVPVGFLIMALVMVGKDLGTTLVLVTILMALLWLAGAPTRLFLALAGVLALGATYFVTSAAYRLDRVRSFLNPFADYRGTGWQGAHSILAIATGGWWGRGLGASDQKWGWLPAAHTDFIFSIIGEELGLVGTLVVLALFAALGYAGLRVAGRSDDLFVQLAAGAATAWLMVQAIVNIGGTLGLLPVTGIPLPLVSYGGSALLPTMFALGMLLSFAKREPGAAEALAARGPGPARRLLVLAVQAAADRLHRGRRRGP